MIALPRLVADDKAPRRKFVAQEELVSAAVIILSPAACNEIDLAAAATSKFRCVTAGVNFHFFDEIDSKNIVHLHAVANAAVVNPVERNEVSVLPVPIDHQRAHGITGGAKIGCEVAVPGNDAGQDAKHVVRIAAGQRVVL